MTDPGKAPYQSQTNKWVSSAPDLYQVGSCLAPPAQLPSPLSCRAGRVETVVSGDLRLLVTGLSLGGLNRDPRTGCE